MPQVSRQTPLASRLSPKTNGVLDRIVPVGSQKQGMRLSVYGRPKTGKTRLACSFPKPLLVIGTEDGTASVAGMKGVDFVMLQRCEELTELTSHVIARRKYLSVTLDNGTGFRDMRIAEILGLERAPVQKGWGYAGRDQWIECANSMKQMIRPLFDLARTTELNLVVIAQEQNYGGGDEAGGSGSELLIPSVSSALGKSVCDWVNAECDYVCQTLIREEEVTVETDVAGQKIPMRQKTGKKQYCLRVSPNEVYYAGFRLPNGRILDRDFVVDPSYEKLVKIIKGA